MQQRRWSDQDHRGSAVSVELDSVSTCRMSERPRPATSGATYDVGSFSIGMGSSSTTCRPAKVTLMLSGKPITSLLRREAGTFR